MDLPFALEGFFFEKVNGLTGQRVTFAFHYIIYAPASCHTAATAPFACHAPESNLAPFAVLHVNDVCRWTWQLLLRASFSKRSTGQRVNGSTGQRVTFTFTILYMIADDARLTPPRCKKHKAYDDTRLMPHHCKKHTASFARSTGKFPSTVKYNTHTDIHTGSHFSTNTVFMACIHTVALHYTLR